MPTPVTARPSPSLLERFRVGQPVSAAAVRRWVQDLTWLRAGNAQQVYAGHFLPRTVLAASTVEYPVLYHRRDGMRDLRAAISAHPDTDGHRFQCSLSVNGTGVGQWGGTGQDLVLPSTRHIAATQHYLHGVSSASGIVVAKATLTATDDCKGLRSFAISEVPRATVDPLGDPTEPGLNEAAIEARNRAHTASSPDTADGLRRVLYELDRARTQHRGCKQLATSEDRTFDTFQSSSVGYAPLDWRAHGGDPPFYVRARRLYLESVPNTCTFAVRYYWSGGGTAKVRANCTSLTTGTTASSVITLSTSGAWTVQTAALSLPVDGVGQMCAITFDADSDATVIDISNLAIFDTEP